MEQSFFWCHPWDIADEGEHAALDRLFGEIGVNAVSIAVMCDDLTAFRPRLVDKPKTLATSAAAHFQPSSSCYANTRIKPLPAAGIKSRNSLAKIARIAETKGLQLRAWTSCCRNRALAARYPMAACVDVFGDAMRSRLCPSNPDVREFLAALIEDLSVNHAFETVELDDIGFDREIAAGSTDHLSFAPNEATRLLMSWCFCPSCRQRAADADVDVEAAHAVVLATFEKSLRLEPTDSPDRRLPALFEEHQALAGYQRMRVDTVTSLVKQVRARTSARLVVHSTAEATETGILPAELAPYCDGLVMPWSHAVGLNLPKDGSERADMPPSVEIAFDCSPKHGLDGPTLVSRVHEAIERGHKRVGFFNYGQLPEPCLSWVRQAIRFARRESVAS